VATAYFSVGGFGLLQDGLRKIGSFRLILGAEPESGEQLGLAPRSDAVRGLIRSDIEDLPFAEGTLRLVEDLIAFLQREKVFVRLYQKGFLHAKCWLFYSDESPRTGQLTLDRFQPVLAIVGSSNFTAPGLTSNRELNLVHKVLLDPAEADDRNAQLAVQWLSEGNPSRKIQQTSRQMIKSEVGARAILDLHEWYESQWRQARDFKAELIELLDASKFGRKEYTPWQIYMKALYEYFRDDLESAEPTATRSAVELAEFQEDAVKKARKILARYDGVMIADSVGLGKTWIGKKLLEDFAYHLRQKAIVVCPASLREMWQRELCEASISTALLSQEELGREEFDPTPWGDADVILVDESHNFRNSGTKRSANLGYILKSNGDRGRAGARKKIILLTATPISNDLLDLYSQLTLITLGDRSYFASAGIGDLARYFIKARRSARSGDGATSLFNLLEEIVIRRTRPFIRKAYPEAMLNGERIRFPDRKLKTVKYGLEATYRGIYDEIVSGIESLRMAPYNLEDYKKADVQKDEMEAGREQALVGIFKSRYLKRFESSVDAFRVSVRRALEFLKTFESYILDGRLLRSSDFHKALSYLSREDEEDDATPTSRADEMDAHEDARLLLEGMQEVDPSKYDLRRLHEAVEHDKEVLSDIWRKIKDISPENDAKLARLKVLLQAPPSKIVCRAPNGDPIHGLRGEKVLIFSYYKDTARYLYRNLGHPENPSAVSFCKTLGEVRIRRMDSGADPKERQRIIRGFAPKSNKCPDWIGTDKEIDILISTDVLSEGQNLQDCGHLLNYDLHWNPTRMVQRAGRIDRIGTDFDTLWIYNMFPDEGLERLLHLVESLSRKISDIDQAGFLDASILGETVHPRNFNTIRRIRDEDGSVIAEEEEFTELASNEFLLQQVRSLLEAGGQEVLDSLPDGIHSGLTRRNARGIFFYFQATNPRAGKSHFWRYFDLHSQRVLDNRYVIANLITCEKNTPRVVEPEMFRSVFEIQEEVIEDILRSVQDQKALESSPRSVDPIQQTIATTLQAAINRPDIDRTQIIQSIRFLNRPMLPAQVKMLRTAHRLYQSTGDLPALVLAVEEMSDRFGNGQVQPDTDQTPSTPDRLSRESLRLICFDFVSGA